MKSLKEVGRPFTTPRARLLTRLSLVLIFGYPVLLLAQSASLFHAQDPSSRIAFLYLSGSRKADIADLNCSLKSVQTNFNEMYAYRIIVMHEDIHQDIRNQLSENYPVEFKRVNLMLDELFNKTHNYPTNTTRSKRSTWGYQNMCRFWFTEIFRNTSILEGLDYYVRLDTDSAFATKIDHDFIREFIEDGVSYGHHVMQSDCGAVVEGLRDFALSYAKSESLVPDQSRWKHVVKPWRGNSCVPLYYNNLEFVNVRRFQENEGMRNWEAAVDKNGGIYWHRWGDAPLRYITTAMFFSDDEVKPLVLDSYRHKYSFLGNVSVPETCLER